MTQQQESESAQRLSQFGAHFASAGASSSSGTSPDDVVVVCAVRTPLTRARKGGFKDTLQEEILAHALRAVVERSGINAGLVEDIQVGNVLPPGMAISC